MLLFAVGLFPHDVFATMSVVAVTIPCLLAEPHSQNAVRHSRLDMPVQPNNLWLHCSQDDPNPILPRIDVQTLRDRNQQGQGFVLYHVHSRLNFLDSLAMSAGWQ